MYVEIGNRISEAREKSKLTQLELAQAIGLTDKTLRGYEKNASKIKLEILKKISEVCGTTVNWLILGDENHINQKGKNNINNGVQFHGENHGTININSSKEMSHAVCEEIKKLPIKKIEYFYHLIKAETLKDN